MNRPAPGRHHDRCRAGGLGKTKADEVVPVDGVVPAPGGRTQEPGTSFQEPPRSTRRPALGQFSSQTQPGRRSSGEVFSRSGAHYHCTTGDVWVDDIAEEVQQVNHECDMGLPRVAAKPIAHGLLPGSPLIVPCRNPAPSCHLRNASTAARVTPG